MIDLPTLTTAQLIDDAQAIINQVGPFILLISGLPIGVMVLNKLVAPIVGVFSEHRF